MDTEFDDIYLAVCKIVDNIENRDSSKNNKRLVEFEDFIMDLVCLLL